MAKRRARKASSSCKMVRMGRAGTRCRCGGKLVKKARCKR